MTNREWLLNKMQNMSDKEFAEILDDGERICNIISTPNFECASNCQRCIKNWLKQEHKEPITLSEAERIILENIDKDYKWIARDKFGDLYVYDVKPEKEDTDWCWVNKVWVLTGVKHLFQFITWEDEQPYNIEELLKCGD